MIEENVRFNPERPVLEQVLAVNKLTYKEFAQKLQMTEGALRNIRGGHRGFKFTMRQIKTLSELLKPLDIRLEELPNDWIVEKKEKIAS